MSEYRHPLIDLIINDFNANGPADLKNKWYHGDVLIVPKNELPCGYVTIDQTLVQPADNMTDEHILLMVVSVLYDYTADLKESQEIVKGVSGLYRLMEERDATTKYLKNNSLVGRIRLGQQIDTNVWLGLGSPVQVNYGMGFERRGPGIFSVEATLRFSLRAHLPRQDLI